MFPVFYCIFYCISYCKVGLLILILYLLYLVVSFLGKRKAQSSRVLLTTQAPGPELAVSAIAIATATATANANTGVNANAGAIANAINSRAFKSFVFCRQCRRKTLQYVNTRLRWNYEGKYETRLVTIGISTCRCDTWNAQKLVYVRVRDDDYALVHQEGPIDLPVVRGSRIRKCKAGKVNNGREDFVCLNPSCRFMSHSVCLVVQADAEFSDSTIEQCLKRREVFQVSQCNVCRSVSYCLYYHC